MAYDVLTSSKPGFFSTSFAPFFFNALPVGTFTNLKLHDGQTTTARTATASSANFVHFTEVSSTCSRSTMSTSFADGRHVIFFRISTVTGNPSTNETCISESFQDFAHWNFGLEVATRFWKHRAADDIQGDAGNIIFSDESSMKFV